LNRKNNSN